MWQCNVQQVREFGHIINLCVYRHYDIGTHTISNIHTWIREYVSFILTYSFLFSCRRSRQFCQCARWMKIMYSGAYIEYIYLTYPRHIHSHTRTMLYFCTTNVPQRSGDNNDIVLCRISWHLCKWRRRLSHTMDLESRFSIDRTASIRKKISVNQWRTIASINRTLLNCQICIYLFALTIE